MKTKLYSTLLLTSLLTLTACNDTNDDNPSADNIDTTVTMESVMTQRGAFFPFGYYYDGSYEAYISKSLLVNNSFLYYDYNATTNHFDEVNVNYDDEYEIHLVSGEWVTKSQAEWNAAVDFTFNANGSLIVTDEDHSFTATLAAYNVQGESIAAHYDDTSLGLPTTATFSPGAQKYTAHATETFVPSYEIDFYTYEGANTINGNANYEYYFAASEPTPYTTLSNFMNDKTLSSTNDPIANGYADLLYFWGSEENYLGLFSAGNTITLYDYTNDAGYTELTVSGSYEIKTIGSTEVLVLTLPDIARDDWMIEDNDKIIYSVQNGAVREGSYNYAASDDNDFGYNEIAAKDIYNLILAQNTPQAQTAPARSRTTLKQKRDEQKYLDKVRFYLQNRL